MSNIYESLESLGDETRTKLWESFYQSMESDYDAAKEFERLVMTYDSCLPEVQGIINYVVASFCGYSIPTIGNVEEDLNANLIDPSYVKSITLADRRRRRPATAQQAELRAAGRQLGGPELTRRAGPNGDCRLSPAAKRESARHPSRWNCCL
jgi:hypothetical protein